MRGFKNGLKITLDLKLGTKKIAIEAGDIKALSIHQEAFRFEAFIRFWVVSIQNRDQDELIAHFIKDSPIDVTLTLQRKFERPGSTTAPWVLKGLVYERAFFEQEYSSVSGEPVLQREYQMRFADPHPFSGRTIIPSILCRQIS